jgi:hypothetical protein
MTGNLTDSFVTGFWADAEAMEDGETFTVWTGDFEITGTLAKRDWEGGHEGNSRSILVLVKATIYRPGEKPAYCDQVSVPLHQIQAWTYTIS